MPTTFTSGATSLVFSANPRRPTLREIRYQAQGESAVGARSANPVLASERIYDLEWPGMTTANLASLEAFVRDTSAGVATAFNWTDAAGAVRSVRFAEPVVTSRDVAPGRHFVSISLKGA